jgi:hypothetical protein
MKASERRLLGAFLLILLLAGTVLLVDIYRKKVAVINDQRDELEFALIEIDELLEMRDEWMTRNDWLRANQPPFTSRQQIDNEIFEDAKAREAEGIEVSDIKFLEPVSTPYYEQAGVTLTVSGSLESVFRWIHSVQRPEEFRVVRNVRVIPDEQENGRIRCSLQLLRWYAPASS